MTTAPSPSAACSQRGGVVQQEVECVVTTAPSCRPPVRRSAPAAYAAASYGRTLSVVATAPGLVPLAACGPRLPRTSRRRTAGR
ncbi:hypothetical protein [Kribbella italica]|uniref:Uncharacterized protein n=1 Tax=Kribbella italica TaxID=1540520 RepID=A0A7W9J7N9_9ACTN|nr:hypothetical protein [Kribbella italica]MBB5836607.1 hypothetical protein [Kribbella italica]